MSYGESSSHVLRHRVQLASLAPELLVPLIDPHIGICLRRSISPSMTTTNKRAYSETDQLPAVDFAFRI